MAEPTEAQVKAAWLRMLKEDYGDTEGLDFILRIELVWQLKQINRRIHATNAQLARIADRLMTIGR